MGVNTANELEDSLLAKLKGAAYPAFRCSIVSLLIELEDLYGDLYPEEYLPICRATVAEALGLVISGGKSSPLGMSALAREWAELAVDGLGVIETGLNYALMAHLLAAHEFGEVPGVPKYAACNYITSALLYYSELQEGEDDLLRIPVDGPAGEALALAIRIVEESVRLTGQDSAPDPRAIYATCRHVDNN